jgi:hypothetical protein
MHPVELVPGPHGADTVIGFFLATLALNIILSLFAIGRTHHRGLWRYTPTMWLYFHIATIAAFKALYENISKPFFWDKTSHGHSFSKLGS